MKDYGGALESFNRALSLAETEEEKSEILASITETASAEKISRTEGKTAGFFLKADRLASAGKYAEARREYEAMKKISEKDFLKEIALFNIAELYRIEKDYGNAHRTYREIFSLPEMTPYYRIYGLFRQAEVYAEQKEYGQARSCCENVLKIREALESHLFKARLFTGDMHRAERNYGLARSAYANLLKEQESSDFPHESYRRELIDRLESIEGLADGYAEKNRQEKLFERINSAKDTIYVSPQGNDGNTGAEDNPFATIKRSQEEVRKIKEKGMPEGGITVCLRGGKYFVAESIIFGKEDSGIDNSPVVYRSYPGEEARLIGGRQLTNFQPLKDSNILRRIPEEARGKIWAADLKQAGITDYGQFYNRGSHNPAIQPGAMELFYNTVPMRLARWPKEGWENVADLVNPEGDGKAHGRIFQKSRFRYSGNRPERWDEEKEIWAAGYFHHPWDKLHVRVLSIDKENRIIKMAPDTRWPVNYPPYNTYVNKNTPYYLYNILSELSAPGEFYIDRDAGKLYFYPPDKIEGSEIIVSTLNSPIIEMKNASNTLFFGLTLEATWRKALKMQGGSSNLIAGCTVRNTGNLGIVIDGGWNNGISGCDIYDTGEGGILVTGGDEEKLIPGCHYAENNHIYRFNRFSHSGGKRAISIYGSGNRAQHNLLHDAPYLGLYFRGSNHIIEYNEIYDVMNEGRDGGAVYTHSGAKYLMDRGNVMRYNFIHHITEESSPQVFHSLVTGMYIDGLGGGFTMEGNIFHKNTDRAMYIHGPDNRVENSLFIDNNMGIDMVDRSYLLDATTLNTIFPRSEDFLKQARYKQPPWSSRYPQLKKVFEDILPLGRTEKNIIERNLGEDTPLVRLPRPINPGNNIMRNNWSGGKILFVDPEQMDFRIRPGAPVFGITGAEPLPFERIGVYESPLRASWPVKRLPAGKYFKSSK